MSIFPKILLASDVSEDAQRAVEMATGLCATLGSELHVAYVAHEHPYLHAYYDLRHQEDEENFQAEAERTLEESVDRVSKTGGTVAESHLRVGEAAKEIVELAEELGVGLVVLGSSGRGRMRRALMGSVATSVLRHAHCSVLVARDPGHGPERGHAYPPGKILVAVDGSQESSEAARVAGEIAKAMGSEAHLVYAMQEERYRPHLGPEMWEGWEEGFAHAKRSARSWVEEQAEPMRSEGVKTAESHLVLGRPDAAIVWLAEKIGAGLVVVGSRGLGSMKRTLIGSVSDSVARHGHCPVMVVRKEMR
jgi:nucleotide-binding universal stress UspA family protein